MIWTLSAHPTRAFLDFIDKHGMPFEDAADARRRERRALARAAAEAA
ncbi:hypothetical protein [Caulobacter endophyticus]|nr:hypothetical protein [Caulobacter endophyticus]